MGEIYDIRSATEHLNEDRYLEMIDCDDQPGFKVQDTVHEHEAFVECIARKALARVIGDETLWRHFGNRKALEEFWKLKNKKQEIWGDPFDPL